MPGVQKPHCIAWQSRKACWSGLRPSGGVRPSIVVTVAPSSCTAKSRQLRALRPSTSTVQAPHTPCSQPTWVPVSPRSSRRKSASERRASISRSTTRPLTVRRTVRRSLGVVIGDPAGAARAPGAGHARSAPSRGGGDSRRMRGRRSVDRSRRPPPRRLGPRSPRRSARQPGRAPRCRGARAITDAEAHEPDQLAPLRFSPPPEGGEGRVRGRPPPRRPRPRPARSRRAGARSRRSPSPATWAGIWISVRISSASSAVVSRPRKNASAATVRAPRGPVRTRASRATSAAGSSAAGSACARLPPSVPLVPDGRVAHVAGRLGEERRPLDHERREAASSAWRARAPMRSPPSAVGVDAGRARAAPLTSTSTAGRTRRMFSIGTRLCPPARSLASPGAAASSATASARLSGARVAERGGLHVLPSGP